MTWEAINNLAHVATIASITATGVVKGYQAHASPYISLTESERTLEKVRSRLKGLSQQRRDEIEIATQSKVTNCKSLKDLEGQLEDLMDTHCVLSKESGEVTFVERFRPYSNFRKNVADLKKDVAELLNDTQTTTVPYFFEAQNPRWSMDTSRSESPDAVSTPSAPLVPDAYASTISVSRAV